MVRRALALALAALLALPATALGHATLQSTVPERGAQLDSAPAEVVFKFDEAVEASFGALRVFDSSGQEVQIGKAFHPGGKGAEIAIKLKPGLGDGTYTATFRVVSADGHPVSSGFVFTVGEAAPPSESLDELLAGGGSSGSVTNTALSVARGFQYGAIALGLGALIFLLVVLAARCGVASRAFTARLERILLGRRRSPGSSRRSSRSCCRAPSAQGSSFWAAASPDTSARCSARASARAWGLGALAWVLVLIALATRPLRGRDGRPAAAGARAGARRRRRRRRRPRPRRRRPRPAGARALDAASSPRSPCRSFALALLPSLGGHTSVQQPVAVLLPANIVHVLAMSRVARRDRRARVRAARRHRRARAGRADAAAGRRRRPLLRAGHDRARRCCSLTGVVQSIVEVGSFGALLDTAFGRAVLIKIVVALAIVALGFVNRQRHAARRSRPRDDARPHRRAAAAHAARRARARPRRDRRHRRAVQLRALGRRVLRPVRDDRQRRPDAGRGAPSTRPRPARTSSTSTCSTPRPARRSSRPRS